MPITYLWPLVLCCSPECRFLSFLSWLGNYVTTDKTLILHLTFGYHQAGINWPILDSLETVWDRVVSLHSSYAVSEAESSKARRFHWDNVPIPGGHTQSCLYTAPSAVPWIWQQLACFQPLSPSLLLHPLTFYLKALPCVCVGRVRGDIVTKAMVPLWKASVFRGPIKTEGSALLKAD